MQIVSSIDMTIPFWGLLIAALYSAYYVISLRNDFFLFKKETEIKLETIEKDLTDIKKMLYDYLNPLGK